MDFSLGWGTKMDSYWNPWNWRPDKKLSLFLTTVADSCFESYQPVRRTSVSNVVKFVVSTKAARMRCLLVVAADMTMGNDVTETADGSSRTPISNYVSSLFLTKRWCGNGIYRRSLPVSSHKLYASNRKWCHCGHFLIRWWKGSNTQESSNFHQSRNLSLP